MPSTPSLLPRLASRRPWQFATLAFTAGAIAALAIALVLVGSGGLGITHAQGSKSTLISNTLTDVPQGETKGVGAFCPSGTHVTGGGYAIGGVRDGGNVFVTFAAPVIANPPQYQTDSYGVTIANISGGDSVSVTAYALCTGN